MARIAVFHFLALVAACTTSCRKEDPPQAASHPKDQPKDPGPATLHSEDRQEVPQINVFKFFQRLSKNNYWDKGKIIPLETGEAILSSLSAAKIWSAEVDPQYASAWGTHPYTPGYDAALEATKAGITTRYTICSGCDLFGVGSTMFVVPREKKEALINVLQSLSDRGRVKFWR
jgi:hypothetical protein